MGHSTQGQHPLEPFHLWCGISTSPIQAGAANSTWLHASPTVQRQAQHGACHLRGSSRTRGIHVLMLHQ
jgi:hypothetical protein